MSVTPELRTFSNTWPSKLLWPSCSNCFASTIRDDIPAAKMTAPNRELFLASMNSSERFRVYTAPGILGKRKCVHRVLASVARSEFSIQSLKRFRVGSECLAIDLEISLVHNHRASIHDHRHGRGKGGAPVFELVYRIVVQVVEELWPV